MDHKWTFSAYRLEEDKSFTVVYDNLPVYTIDFEEYPSAINAKVSLRFYIKDAISQPVMFHMVKIFCDGEFVTGWTVQQRQYDSNYQGNFDDHQPFKLVDVNVKILENKVFELRRTFRYKTKEVNLNA